ncbi:MULTISPECIES: Crp/Fnr family transcriptional regulator [Peptoniphilus]|uniref:Crp/Fnr family transcriptional regulator n=1 Tax=Peptoniphilus TaxID=162289 RepID=UPI0003B8F7DA|nr:MULTISPECIES: Crp/Fnr family transcriptional regulator [Peptoniphilus]ERT64491.1 cyclic nucleotide-binding domain protein [Peptoniphilus sp. BV3AC2]MDK8276540.1 Crp/Fnr family transcriptional regulator [Peptoniphilus duerdenii]
MKEIILKSKIFKNIEENEVDLLLKCINNYRKTFKKGEIILREGEKTEYMGIVITGSVVVERADLWGNNTVLGVISPGGIFAETYSILNDEPLMINVYANEKSEILFLRTNEIFKTCEKSCNFHDQLILNLIRIASFKNLNLSRKILHTGPKTIRGKLLSFFSEWVKKENSLSFSIPYNRQQLADYLSVDRSAMSNELSKMQKEGILEFKKNKFKIIDKNIIF